MTLTADNGEPISITDGESVTVTVGSARCTGSLSAGTGTCSITDTALPASGPYAVTASYAVTRTCRLERHDRQRPPVQTLTVTQDSTTTNVSVSPRRPSTATSRSPSP